MELKIRRFYEYVPDIGKVKWRVVIPTRAQGETTKDGWFLRGATERLKELVGDFWDVGILILDEGICLEGYAPPGEARERARDAQSLWMRYIASELRHRSVEDGEEEVVVNLEECEE